MTEKQIATIAQKIHLELSAAEAEDGILDELVHETASSMGVSESHQHDEDMADAILDRYSNLGSEVNNRGWMGQVAWLLENDVSEAEIRKAIKIS